MQTGCPTQDVILLDSFLACLYASLRFSYLQRMEILVFDRKTVRGSCWRTTTSSSGQHFGFLAHGMWGKGDHSGALKWLQALGLAQHGRAGCGAAALKSRGHIITSCTEPFAMVPLLAMGKASC